MKRTSLIYSLLLFLALTSFVHAQNKLLTVEDICTNEAFIPEKVEGIQWYSDSKKFSYMKYDPFDYSYCIFEHDVESGNIKKLVSEKNLFPEDNKFNFVNYTWSEDHHYISFTGVMRARSLKTGGTFLIYDVLKGKVAHIIDSKDEQENIKFSPDSRKIGFVRGNNIYTLDLESGKEKQLTFNGSENLLNGRFDWVYEEEFSIIDGWQWSPDSKKIAFWQLDQSDVPVFKIPLFDSLYTNFLNEHYPKAGNSNSIVNIGVIDVNNGSTVWMDIGKDKDIYIPRIQFTRDANILSVQRLNRIQNHLELILYETNTGKGKTIINETRDTWLDIEDNLTFLHDGRHFIWSSDRDGFNHLYLYDMNGLLVNQITKGNYDVIQLQAAEGNRVYYISNERGRIYRDLYSINLNGTDPLLLTNDKGNHDVNAAPSGKYFIDEYSNTGTMSATFIIDNNGRILREISDKRADPLKSYSISPVHFFNFKTSDNFELDACIIKPRDFDSTKKYPVLIEQYSGPGARIVKDSWRGSSQSFLWEELLAQKGFIIVCVDPRTVGGRGSAYKKLAYKNLGKWEVNDLIETAKYLNSIPYVDPKKIGIWGWSYGGYMASLAILKGADYFSTAIAVAPVTHWKFYDDIYTERYMSLPQLNPQGYEESSPLNYVNKLKGNFLLIHGMADDNVHFQNSVELVKALIGAQKKFQVMYYPGKEHSLSGTEPRINLYNLMTDFLIRNLKD